MANGIEQLGDMKMRDSLTASWITYPVYGIIIQELITLYNPVFGLVPWIRKKLGLKTGERRF